VVVAHERPDLERQWAELVTQMGDSAQLLVTLEDTLLRELSSSSGECVCFHKPSFSPLPHTSTPSHISHHLRTRTHLHTLHIPHTPPLHPPLPAGNILDNSELIATLENTKSKATEIGAKLQLATSTKADISVARAVYKVGVCVCGHLFSCVLFTLQC
jgi:dynein heavy chain